MIELTPFAEIHKWTSAGEVASISKVIDNICKNQSHLIPTTALLQGGLTVPQDLCVVIPRGPVKSHLLHLTFTYSVNAC